MNPVLRVADHLEHIAKAMERIFRYANGLDEAAFLSNELVQDAVLRNFEIIGEAANRVLRTAPEFAARQAHVPWLLMYTMRNRISHGYDTVDLPLIWQTIRQNLPALHAQIRALLAAGFEPPPGQTG